jgi:hypothetical protein
MARCRSPWARAASSASIRPRLEHLLRLLRRGLGDHGAAVRDQRHQALAGQARQHRPDAGARHPERRRQLVFHQPGARRQAVVQHRRDDALVHLGIGQGHGRAVDVAHRAAPCWRWRKAQVAAMARPITANDTTVVSVPSA